MRKSTGRLVPLIGGIVLLAVIVGSAVHFVLREKTDEEATASHERMLALLQDVDRRAPDEHWMLGD